MKNAIRQSAISIFMTIAATAVQHTTWSADAAAFVTLVIVIAGGFFVAVIGDMP